jgi:phytoene desaturase
LLEAQNRVGGRCSAIESEGFRFDVGPTFFLYPRILQEIFHSVGLDLRQEVPMRRLDPQYRVTFGEGGEDRRDAADGQDGERDLCVVAARRWCSLKRYLDDNRVKLEKFRPNLQSRRSTASSIICDLRLWAAAALRQSLGERWAMSCSPIFKDPRLAIAFSFQIEVPRHVAFPLPQLVLHIELSWNMSTAFSIRWVAVPQ